MNQKNIQIWAVRLAFAVVFAWFGIPKILEVSPATQLVTDLLKMTLPFFPPREFLLLFGAFELIIGIGFLIPKFTKLTIITTLIHLCMTMLPLVLLPQHTWTSFGVLSTEGQYIMKNLVLYAALWGLWLDESTDIPSNRVTSGSSTSENM